MESESENVFGDELGLSECFTAHSGTAGAQTPIDPPAAVRVNKPQVQRDVVGEELRKTRMELVATYNLTEDSRKFALEQILARSPDDCDRDLLTMPAEDAALLRKADTSNTVDFWSGKQSAHGGYRHRFDELFGSMGVAAAGADAPRTLYYKVEDKSPGRAAHERNVQGPVVVSAMYRSGLLGNASMKQVQALWDLTCVGGELGWYVSNFCVDVLFLGVSAHFCVCAERL